MKDMPWSTRTSAKHQSPVVRCCPSSGTKCNWMRDVGTESSRSNRPRTSETHPRMHSSLRSRRLRYAARHCCSAVVFLAWSNQVERSTKVPQIREISCMSGLSFVPACAHLRNYSTMCVAVRHKRPWTKSSWMQDSAAGVCMPSAFACVSFAFTSAGSACRGSSADADGICGLRCGIEVSFSPASGCPHRPRPCSRVSSAGLGCPSASCLGEVLGFPAGSFLVNTWW